MSILPMTLSEIKKVFDGAVQRCAFVVLTGRLPRHNDQADRDVMRSLGLHDGGVDPQSYRRLNYTGRVAALRQGMSAAVERCVKGYLEQEPHSKKKPTGEMLARQRELRRVLNNLDPHTPFNAKVIEDELVKRVSTNSPAATVNVRPSPAVHPARPFEVIVSHPNACRGPAAAASSGSGATVHDYHPGLGQASGSNTPKAGHLAPVVPFPINGIK